MADILLAPALGWVLSLGAVCFGAGGVLDKRHPWLWTLLSGVCTVSAVLQGLLLGQTLTEALTVVLAVAAVALAGLARREGGGP